MTGTELLTPKETAKRRRCSVRKLDRERAEGRGPQYVRIDDRVFYRSADIEEFIAAHVCGGKHASAAVATDTPLSPSVAPPRRRGRPRKAPTIAGANAP
jgi:hypothetical protein